MADSVEKEQAGGNKMRAARLSSEQFEVLIDFMQQNPYFAVGRAAGGAYTKDEHDRLWKTLSDALNETKGPIKSVNKWQKCWVDLKSNARSRAAKWRAKSLDGPLTPGSMFTPWDDRILTLLNEINCDNNSAPVVSHSPLQFLEVGLSDKVSLKSKTRTSSSSLRTHRPKFRSVAAKLAASSANGYLGSETDTEPVDSNNFDYEEGINLAPRGVDGGSVVVKAERDEWLEEENAQSLAGYSPNSSTSRNDPESNSIHYLPNHNVLSPSEEPLKYGDPLSDEIGPSRAHKRKLDEHLSSVNVEDSFERLSKKVCGTLDRIASAAEEANAIQHGMVSAMNRLASSFEQLLPVVARVLSKK